MPIPNLTQQKKCLQILGIWLQTVREWNKHGDQYLAYAAARINKHDEPYTAKEIFNAVREARKALHIAGYPLDAMCMTVRVAKSLGSDELKELRDAINWLQADIIRLEVAIESGELNDRDEPPGERNCTIKPRRQLNDYRTIFAAYLEHCRQKRLLLVKCEFAKFADCTPSTVTKLLEDDDFKALWEGGERALANRRD